MGCDCFGDFLLRVRTIHAAGDKWADHGGSALPPTTENYRRQKQSKYSCSRNFVGEIKSLASTVDSRISKKTIQRFTQRGVKFIRWLKNHLNTWRTWGHALLASTHLVPQTKEAGITNAGTTGFPLNPLGLFGSEFDIRARAHPTARHGADKIFPT